MGAQAAVGRGAAVGFGSVSRYTIVVSTTADRVNGNVSSVAALNAQPGRDGISLREALEAANHTRGGETIYVMFSQRLNGRTIWLRGTSGAATATSGELFLHRDHVVLEGVAPNGAPARVTIDGRRAHSFQMDALLLIQASDVTVRWLRFTGLDAARNQGKSMSAVQVQAGIADASSGPSTVANVRIEDDVFDNRGFYYPDSGAPRSLGVLMSACCISGRGIGTDRNTHWRTITIARSQFLHLTEGVGLWINSVGSTSSGVAIQNNQFDNDPGTIGIELGEGGLGPHETGTQIIGNTISGDATAITLDSSAKNGTIDGTQIEDNTISAARPAAINLDAEAAFPGSGPAGNDVLTNTQIVNNVIHQTSANALSIWIGGGDGASPGSRVSGVTIENDTIVSSASGGTLLTEVPNQPGASGNTITGVVIRNTILWDPNGTPVNGPAAVYLQPPDVVANSLISGPDWAGSNGNINTNPAFVNAAAGDYHLGSGSPAINAGTTTEAPAYDLDGSRRDSQPDIGAYEYGAAPRPLLTVTAYPLGGSGTITSTPASIACGTVCAARFDPNTTVTLTARPDRWSHFQGWQGACTGKGPCTVKLAGDTTAAARFDPKPRH